ncbi:AP-5 complex subunit mu-1-like [Argonauta hians]
MKIRSLWVYYMGSSTTSSPRLIFSRRFPTVEKWSVLNEKEQYVPIPQNAEFTKNLFNCIRSNSKLNKNSEQKCSNQDKSPFYTLNTALGKLYPVVIWTKEQFLFCCLPFVESTSHSKSFLIEIPGITLCHGLLSALSDIVNISHLNNENSLFNDISTFLIEAVPLGKIRDVNLTSINTKIANKPILAAGNQKQPAWRPNIHKGKNQMYICVSENVRAAICGTNQKRNDWEVYGKVTCKCDLDGIVPEVTLNIIQMPTSERYCLDNFTVHPCVQSADVDDVLSDNQELDSRISSRRIRFIPPQEQFTLCNYSVSDPRDMPITGYYDMQVEPGGKVVIEVRLTLNPKIKNSFEVCELQIPIYNRGLVQSYEVNASQGSVQLVDKRKLVWNIGQKFPSKSLEVFLTSTLILNKQLPTKPDMYEDPFCIDLNSYILLTFRINDFTQSGCHVDSKSVQVKGKAKCKLNTVHEYVSSHYKFWNIHGNSLTITPQS